EEVQRLKQHAGGDRGRHRDDVADDGVLGQILHSRLEGRRSPRRHSAHRFVVSGGFGRGKRLPRILASAPERDVRPSWCGRASSPSRTAPRHERRRALSAVAIAAAALCLVGFALAGPRPFREYPGVEYENFELPPDYMQPAEWTFARLMYPTYGWRRDDWKSGGTN